MDQANNKRVFPKSFEVGDLRRFSGKGRDESWTKVQRTIQDYIKSMLVVYYLEDAGGIKTNQRWNADHLKNTTLEKAHPSVLSVLLFSPVVLSSFI